MSNNPTIVAASLDDKQMHQSIVNLVAEVKRATHTMTQDFDSVVDHINAKFKELGNGKNISAKGGVSANATKQSTQAVEENTNAIKRNAQTVGTAASAADKQIKKNQEVSMSFDQIVAVLDRARRTVSDFNTKRANGFLPSTEDYKRYEQALARIVEYNDKLKQSALGKAFGNEQAFAFDAKRVVSDITAVDDRLKQLGQHFADLEKQSQKAADASSKQFAKEMGQRSIQMEQMRAFYQEQERLSKESAKIQNKDFRDAYRGALSMPANNIDEVRAKIERLKALLDEMRDKKGKGLINVSESDLNRVSNSIARLNQQIDKDAQKRLAAIEKESAAQKKMIDDQYKLAFARANKIPTDQIDLAQAKLERLQALLRDMRERGILSNTQIASTEAEIRKLEQVIGQVNTSQQQTTQSAQRYTEEIRKQAKAIRESKDWNTKGTVLVNDRVYYNPEKVKGVKSLEEQILQTIKDQEIAEIRKASAAQSAAAAQQAELQQSKAILNTETRITEEINKRKKYSSPDMQVGYDVTRDKLAQIIAGKNNIQANQVVNWDEQKSSIKTLSAALKQYQDTYAKMSAIERNSPFGKQIISDIQVLERNIQKARREMSRPLSFSSAMAGSERTLDDIALKMQRLRAYRQSIDITKPNAANDIKQVDDALAKLQRDMDKYMSKSKQVNEINTALGRSWNYMKNRLAFYFTVGATTQFVKSLVDIRGQYELLERSIGILVDSAQNGSRIFAELNAMAINSPFTTMELGAAAKQLVAYDVAAKDVVDTTKRLADMAAAVGVPIERLTYALGQIKSYSYLNARDARMFANTGIPLVKNLADMYTKLEGRLVSTSDVYDRIKKKAVSYNDVMRVVNEMTDEGGKFFNFQEKAADTLKVKIANLTLAYNNMLNEMGKSNQGFISGGLGALKTLMEHWRDVYNTILALVPAYGAAKIAQLLLFKAVNKTTMATAAQAVFSEKLVAKWQAVTVAAKGATAASIGVSLATAGILALVAVLGKLAWDYYDLKQANEDFNKSVIDGAEENIQSISKFFDDYKKELKEISGASSSDQQKMWERMQEEIEKTVRNAQDYIDILEKIDDTASRIKAGEDILGQQQVIEQEIKDFASRGMLDLGGGFADDSLAEDLKQYDEYVKGFVKDFHTLDDTAKRSVTALIRDYSKYAQEADNEIDAFISKLQGLDFDKIMGDFDEQTQFANIRNAVSILRDGFLATEQGSKIGYEGQARLNAALDKYISSLGRSKNLIQDVTVNGKKYSASQVAAIEANRSAWEKFFSRIKPNQKKMLDFAVKTGRMNAKQLQEIWDYAAKEMQKTDLTAYTSIQDHIAQLRNTPDIVLNIVYKERTEESKDPVIKDYTKHFLTPHAHEYKDADTYIKKEKELYKKYGTLIKKEGEDRVEWGERVFKTIHDEEKKAAEATKALAELQKELTTETKRAGDARYQAAKKQKEESEEIIKNAKEVVKYEKLHDKEKKKGKQKDPILDALKLETELVEKLNAEYEGLMKNGAKSPEALASLHKTFGKTISQLNSQLKSFGLPQLDLAKILVGRNPKKQLEHFQKTLDSLVKNGLLNMERSKVVEAVIEKVSIRAENYDLTELSKGIEKELNKLKESFDLGTALDAEPQLGNLFAKMYGFDTKELPRTFTELVQKAQSIIDNAFKGRDEAKIDVSAILDKNAFEEWVKGTERELDSSLVQTVQKMRDSLLEIQRKMISDTSKTYDKLLERYSEYQFKLIKIDKDSAADRLALIRKFATEQQSGLVHQAVDITNDITLSTDPEERERLSKELQDIVKKIADGNEAVIQIGIGIDTKEAEEKAQVAFDEFTKNPEWQTAIGDLEGMTHDALRMLIKDLEDFIKTNKKLTTKQIRQIEGTITKLHKQIRKNNPFAAIADTIEEAENRTKKYEDAINKAKKELEAMLSIPEYKRTEDDRKRIVDLTRAIDEWEKKMRKIRAINMGTIFGNVNDTINSISSITSEVTKLLDALGGTQATEASKTISNIVGNMEAAGKGAQIGASFGGYGAVIGAVAGGLTDLATRLANEWSGNEKINEAIERSVRSVKRLEMAYANLEHQMKESYGEGELYAKKLLVANKKVQLAELQKQLLLEQSRKNKNRDYDKELDLQQQINDLTNELNDDIKDIVNSLLGISSVKDAASTLVDAMIDAFKSGEDYMQKFGDSFEDMIDHMIAQAVVGRLIGDKVQKIVDFVNSKVNVDTEELLNERTANEMKMKELEVDMKAYKALGKWGVSSAGKTAEEYKALKERNDEIERLLQSGSQITPEIVEEARKLAQDMTDETKYEFDLLMDMFGIKFGQKSNLSNLQQGISAITEDTAGALEAYMNGVSQQVYAHTELLTEIRDAVIAFNGDATLGVQSQMLLQLQNNYILMQTMQTLMENWTVPSGNGIRVELMN